MKNLCLMAVALATAFFLVPIVAIAQNGPETIIPPTSFLFDVWEIVQPIAVVLGTTVGPIIGLWIAKQVITLLNITEATKSQELEDRLREALHASAMNALKYAAAKAGLPPVALAATSSAVRDAITYIKTKNPDAIDAFGLSDKALQEIILSKLPEVNAILASAKQLPQSPPIGGTAAPL
ncbi:hypothetical protein LJR231_001803 [Phyllobacterium sp. LjRoot231]|uniref:hypothetical protein n=1 Tax=Phyllobacterium sp. LjRoot231 TaxID=3342289 RepID=UPI003ED0B2FC